MRVALRLEGEADFGGKVVALGPAHALLAAVSRERSVRGAAERLGVSYRSAWGRIADLEAAIGQSLVTKTKGHGTLLTDLGARLLDALGPALTDFDTRLQEAERSLEASLAGVLEAPTAVRRLAASHDPLLMSVLADRPGIEVTVIGSLDAVHRLTLGEADLAGFHFGALHPTQASPFGALFHDPDLEVRPLFRREQGLMLAPGHGLAIGSIGDLAATRARFVNRQKGSGTRLWFDRLLREAGVSPQAVVGYEVEEFTHQAVAAVIASGAADAGMGVRAVAERFGLRFLPFGQETYFVAGRPPAVMGLIETAGQAIADAATSTPGYEPVAPEAGAEAERGMTISRRPE